MKRILSVLLFSLLWVSTAFAANNLSSDVTPQDCSGSITLGGTAQNAFTASQYRNGFVIANIDTTEVMWISFTGTATAGAAGSFPLAPATATTFAGTSSFLSAVGFNKALSVVAATTSHKFSCTRW